MSYLLDANVLLALVDQNHVHHEPAQRWFSRKSNAGWHTCPITQTAFLRILGQPKYPWAGHTFADAIGLFHQLLDHPNHSFIECDADFGDVTLFQLEALQGHRQVTDVYLLGLAAKHRIRLATFDRAIAISAVRQGKLAIEWIEA
jgi:hypothetical protein